MRLQIFKTTLIVCAFVGLFAACSLYKSDDRGFCDWNCVNGSPTPSTTKTSAVHAIVSQNCEQLAPSADEVDARDVDADVLSSEDRQVVHLIRRTRGGTVACDVTFAPSSTLPITRDLLIEVAHEAVSEQLDARPSPGTDASF